MAQIVWSEPALDDLEEIVQFIASDSPRHAGLTAQGIIKAVDRLKVFPLSGRIVPEAREKMYREVVIGSYRILYSVLAGECRIVAVVHSKRNIATRLEEV